MASLPIAATHLMARVDRFYLGFSIDSIVSAHEAPVVYPLPLAQPGVLGAVNVRGTAIPVADIRRSLRLAPRGVALRDRMLLINAGGIKVGVIVDEIDQLFSLGSQNLDGPHRLFGDAEVNNRIIRGIACAPHPCAIIDATGLAVPDQWDGSMPEVVVGLDLEVDAAIALRSDLLAAPAEDNGKDVRTDVAVFRIGEQHYAVPIANVVEFFSQAAHAPLWYGARKKASLVNRHGEALALYDLRVFLGLVAGSLGPRVDGIVIGDDSLKIAIAVDSLEGLDALPVLASGQPAPGAYCLSLHQTARGSIILLHVAALMAAPALSATGVHA
ncbi:MAG: chemotaxis protein CheW [Candidatus Eremiobacteraeota bacterium]|nr:chemotaxis protein CheW [Candidatus Eremiobacteraeota bacterium]